LEPFNYVIHSKLLSETGEVWAQIDNTVILNEGIDDHENTLNFFKALAGYEV